eukprot:533003-Pyramimonas_sp.AAC.1
METLCREELRLNISRKVVDVSSNQFTWMAACFISPLWSALMAFAKAACRSAPYNEEQHAFIA